MSDKKLCACGSEIKPFYQKGVVLGVGEVVMAKPVFNAQCEKCLLKPFLQKRA